jgi:hypothetical protein
MVPREPITLGGQRKSDGGARQVCGDGMHGRLRCVNQGDLSGRRAAEEPGNRYSGADRAGVRASVGAEKEGNASGAKGRREMDAWKPQRTNTDLRQCLKGLNKQETP